MIASTRPKTSHCLFLHCSYTGHTHSHTHANTRCQNSSWWPSILCQPIKKETDIQSRWRRLVANQNVASTPPCDMMRSSNILAFGPFNAHVMSVTGGGTNLVLIPRGGGANSQEKINPSSYLYYKNIYGCNHIYVLLWCRPYHRSIDRYSKYMNDRIHIFTYVKYNIQ